MHPEHPDLVLFPLHDDPRYALAAGALVREIVGVPQMLCPALVGRGAELEAPVRMLDAGCGGAVVVLGEPGIGKSRLVRELTGHARPRPCRSFRACCAEPAADAVPAAGGGCGGRVPAVAGAGRP
jgi:hypothetical protein